jgi:hypothetical protein
MSSSTAPPPPPPIAFSHTCVSNAETLGRITSIACINHSTRGVLMLIRFACWAMASTIALHDSSKPMTARTSGESFIADYVADEQWHVDAAARRAAAAVASKKHGEQSASDHEDDPCSGLVVSGRSALHGDEQDCRFVFVCGIRTLRKHDLMSGRILASCDGGGFNLDELCLSSNGEILCASGAPAKSRSGQPRLDLLFYSTEQMTLLRIFSLVSATPVLHPRFIGTHDHPPMLRMMCTREAPEGIKHLCEFSAFVLLEFDLSAAAPPKAPKAADGTPLQPTIVWEQPTTPPDAAAEAASSGVSRWSCLVSDLSVSSTQRTSAATLVIGGDSGSGEVACVMQHCGGECTASYNVFLTSSSSAQRMELVHEELFGVVALSRDDVPTHLALVSLPLQQITYTLPLVAVDAARVCMVHVTARAVAVLYYNSKWDEGAKNWIDIFNVRV